MMTVVQLIGHTLLPLSLCHLNIHENFIQESIQLNELSIAQIADISNPADLFTKQFKSDRVFCALQGLLLSSLSTFNSHHVPCLDGGMSVYFMRCLMSYFSRFQKL
jgi:hypothetical protein